MPLYDVEPAMSHLAPSLHLSVPIVQGTLGHADSPALAAAISNAGALGTLSFQGVPEAVARVRLQQVRRRTTRPVLMAFTGPWEREAVLDECLAAGMSHFHVLWWNGPRLTARIHAGGGTVLWQVGTSEQAQEALDHGADVLIAQGTEAGGPVRSPHPIRELLAILRDRIDKRIPIVAGGGLADRDDVEEILAAGATAALIGTRFLLSNEARTSARHKNLLRRACADDLFLDTRLIGTWPCSPRRRLRRALDEDVTGLQAGLGLGKIHDILPAAQIVRRLAPEGPP